MAAFDTHFADKLGTNYVPSSQDRDYIRNLLVEPQNRLTQLDSKISELEQVLETLKQERHLLDDKIQQYHHLLSPARRLPDDMLREIFLACLPNTHNAVMDREEAPLLLGLVCSHWRLLAYSTPGLWATLHIPYPALRYGVTLSAKGTKVPDAYNDCIEKHLTAVWDWLTRSGSCPLSISFRMPFNHASRLPALILHSYISIMSRFSQRWHSLDLTLPAGGVSNLLASIPTTSVSILTHLRLEFSSGMSAEEAEEWKTSGLLHAPRLRALDISYVPFRPSHLPANSWSHLSSLNLIHFYHFPADRNFATIQEAYNILSRCSRLTHCALDIFGGSLDPIPTGCISLPFLKSLCIIESCPSISTLFESFATLPELRGVSYHTREPPSYERQSPLITLLARTNQITYLSSDLNSFTLRDLNAIFALLPNLTHLVNEGSHIAAVLNGLPASFSVEKVLLDLLVSVSLSSGEMFCPRLQMVHINKLHRLSDADILSFIQSRMSAGKSLTGSIEPLREFRTKVFRAMEIDIRAELLDYVEAGTLKLNIVYQPRPIYHKPRFEPHSSLTVTAVPEIVQVCHDC
ncbi:hypothetical protein BJ912DRAFT_45609 [Pholiota molesta]|nr:hypothetical protein BJ912DRAFT_45609 [Pholiota molesta]